MPRDQISAEQLQQILNDELHTHADYEDCQSGGITALNIAAIHLSGGASPMERVLLILPQPMSFTSGVISGVSGLLSKENLSNGAVCSLE